MPTASFQKIFGKGGRVLRSKEIEGYKTAGRPVAGLKLRRLPAAGDDQDPAG